MQMLMDLGANVYSEDFEQHFLAKAAEFYQVRLQPSGVVLRACQQAKASSCGLCAPSLLRLVEGRIQYEPTGLPALPVL